MTDRTTWVLLAEGLTTGLIGLAILVWPVQLANAVTEFFCGVFFTLQALVDAVVDLLMHRLHSPAEYVGALSLLVLLLFILL